MFDSLEEGEVFSWGSGEGGKLGQGHLRDRSTPIRVAELKDKKVIKVACHDYHSSAVCGKSRTLLYLPILSMLLPKIKLSRSPLGFQH